MNPTETQKRLYDYLVETISRTGVAPTYDEMSAATGMSRNHLSGLLTALEERGLIRRMRHRARAIEIVPTDPYSAEALAALPEADLLALQHRLNTALLNATSRRAA